MKTAKLGEVAECLDRLRVPVTEADRTPGDVPYYGANGQQGWIDQAIFNEPLVIVAEDGGHFSDPSRGVAYRIDGPAWVNNHGHVLRAMAQVDTDFLFRVLQNYNFQPYISGSTRSKLTQKQLLSAEVPLPPLTEQRRIAAILDHADALRTKRRMVLAHLDALTTSIFDSLFSGDLPTAPLGELAETRLGKMLDAKKQTGDHRRPYLRNANVQWFRFDLEDLLEMDFTQKDRATFALLPGDVLVCEGGQPGRSAIWRGELDECYFQKALHRVRLGDDLEPEYFAHAMKKIVDSNGLKDFVTSSTIAHLTGEKLRTLPIPVPDLSGQREFAARVEQVRRQTEAVTRALATAADLFGSIRARAFRGEL
ncbi:restriction endonuclease subunit S [Nocardioides sp.]|uniref:restriction endonuclease subunit S n=1 Tax=Nocardioides sp. TaxID=35761 RepID=UPI003511873D